MSNSRFTWIPEHPSNGSASMRRYWRQLEAAIRTGDPFDYLPMFPPDTGDYKHRDGRLLRYAIRNFFYPAKIKRQTCADLVHILDHSWADMLPFAPPRSLKVITVHDLIPLSYPGELSAAQVERFRQRVFNLKNADSIIAVSNYTKNEVVRLLGIESEKIHVVFNGVEISGDAFSRNVSAPLLPRDNRSFHIGSIGTTLKRKNLAILPSALSRLQAKTSRKIVLVRVGLPLPSALAAELKGVLGESGLVELGTVPNDFLPGFYASLDVLAIPSTYEGFGLPVLEGMAAGVPVVASSTSSLPEVGGKQVLYFNPEDPEDMANQMAIVAMNRLPDDWTEMAFARAKQFSWRDTLEGLYRVYDSTLAMKRKRQD